MAEGPVTCQRKWAMVTCAELTAHWDQAIDRFLVGGPAVPKDDRRMRSWFESYRGPGAVHLDALPEPRRRRARAVVRATPCPGRRGQCGVTDRVRCRRHLG